MSSSHSEENLLTETQEDAMGRCFFSLSTPLKVSPHHNKTALNLQEDADFLERSWKIHPAFVPLPSCQGCCSLPYLGGQRHSGCLWPAVGTAGSKAHSSPWQMYMEVHIFMALLPCWDLPGQIPLPSSRKTFPQKGQRADVTSEHSEQQQEKLNSTSGHINTPR